MKLSLKYRNMKISVVLDMGCNRPDHCKGCTAFHTAGRTNPTAELKKYNSWCCQFGKPASKVVGHCINTNSKINIEVVQL